MSRATDETSRSGMCLRCNRIVQWGRTPEGVVMAVTPAAHGTYYIRGMAIATVIFLTPGEPAPARYKRHMCARDGVPSVAAA